MLIQPTLSDVLIRDRMISRCPVTFRTITWQLRDVWCPERLDCGTLILEPILEHGRELRLTTTKYVG